MARICPYCGTEMVEDCSLRVANYDVSVKKGGFFSGVEGRLYAAVCPQCGNVSFYTDRAELFRPKPEPEKKEKAKAPVRKEQGERKEPWLQRKGKEDPWD